MRPEELREKLKTTPLYIIDEKADTLKKERVFKRLGRVLRRALFNLLPRLTRN